MIYRHQLGSLTKRLVGRALIAAFLFDCVALSFPLNRPVFAGGATPLLQSSSNNILYMEPGTDATGDLKFFTSTTGVVNSETSVAFTGPRSIKADSGDPANFALVRKNGVLDDSGRRISYYFRYSAAPAVSTNIIRLTWVDEHHFVRERCGLSHERQQASPVQRERDDHSFTWHVVPDLPRL